MTTLYTSLLPSPSLHDQYPSNPPAALTVVLSIACGIVATCVLFTIVLLLLRHRSSKQAFRQGQQHPRRTFFAKPKSDAGVHVPVVDDGPGSAPDSEDREITIYLPVLHSGSPSTQSKTKTSTPTGTHARGSRRSKASGRIPSLAYPNAVYLGLPRTDTTASDPSHIV